MTSPRQARSFIFPWAPRYKRPVLPDQGIMSMSPNIPHPCVKEVASTPPRRRCPGWRGPLSAGSQPHAQEESMPEGRRGGHEVGGRNSLTALAGAKQSVGLGTVQALS